MPLASADRANIKQQNERSDTERNELIALARMITYARCLSEDLKVELSTHCLDLALKTVIGEIGDLSEQDFPELQSSALRLSVERH
ncbi:hypothetical protein [Rhizobium binxianense]